MAGAFSPSWQHPAMSHWNENSAESKWKAVLAPWPAERQGESALNSIKPWHLSYQSPKLLEVEIDVDYLFMECFDIHLLRNLQGGNAAQYRYLIKNHNSLLSSGCKGALVKVVLGWQWSPKSCRISCTWQSSYSRLPVQKWEQQFYSSSCWGSTFISKLVGCLVVRKGRFLTPAFLFAGLESLSWNEM